MCVQSFNFVKYYPIFQFQEKKNRNENDDISLTWKAPGKVFCFWFFLLH